MLDEDRVLKNLLRHLKTWRNSRRIADEVVFEDCRPPFSRGTPIEITAEEKELRYAYDLLQRVIEQR